MMNFASIFNQWLSPCDHPAAKDLLDLRHQLLGLFLLFLMDLLAMGAPQVTPQVTPIMVT